MAVNQPLTTGKSWQKVAKGAFHPANPELSVCPDLPASVALRFPTPLAHWAFLITFPGSKYNICTSCRPILPVLVGHPLSMSLKIVPVVAKACQ